MKRSRLIVLIVLLLAALAGGAILYSQWAAHHITYQEFAARINGPEGHAATMWRGIDYCGQKDGHAFFANHMLWDWNQTILAIPVEATAAFPTCPSVGIRKSG